jgi:hypothetical protein
MAPRAEGGDATLLTTQLRGVTIPRAFGLDSLQAKLSIGQWQLLRDKPAPPCSAAAGAKTCKHSRVHQYLFHYVHILLATDAMAVQCVIVFVMPLLQGVQLPEDLSWKGLKQWLMWGGAGGEVLLVFENAEDVLCHENITQVGVLRP